MPDYSKNIVYLSKEQYQTLITNQSVTANGQTITYNENDIYVTPQAEPITDVKINNVSIGSNGVANIPVASTSGFGVAKIYNGWGLGSENGQLYILKADATIIKSGYNDYKPIVATNQHQSTFYGLAKAAGADMASITSTTVGVYPPAQKAAIQSMLGVSDLLAPSEPTLVASQAYAVGDVFTANGKLYKATAAIVSGESIVVQDKGETVSEHKAEEVTVGEYAVHDVKVDGTSVMQDGVANIPVAGLNRFGAVKIFGAFGVDIYSGNLIISPAIESQTKAGLDTYKPIVSSNQHFSAFYGLAKAAGDTTQSQSDNAVGTYTVAAKTAIRAMLGATSSNVIEVSDTQPTDTDNKIWMPETAPAGIEVPTYAEFQAGLAGKVSDVQINGSSIVASNVANIPFATSSTYGIVKTSSGKGLTMNNGIIELYEAIEINKGVRTQAIMQKTQHAATFYGLAKAAGADMKDIVDPIVGIYPAAQKAAIQNMLGISNLLAPTETVVASKAYGIGEIFTSNGKLYKATAAIAASDTIVTQDAGETVSGSNAEEIKVSEYAVRDVQVAGTSVVSSGIANIPEASASAAGVVKVANSGGGGLQIVNGEIKTWGASDAEIKNGSAVSAVIRPGNQKKAVFYGLAQAAGDTTMASSSNAVGTYTSEAKAAIQSMLGINLASIASEVEIPLVETVTSTTPTITGEPNTRYNCGEVSTISITPPSTGSVDVIFESGSTAAVLTVPNTVKWPTWFDATTLETDTIYEILITDGVYGSVMTWAS